MKIKGLVVLAIAITVILSSCGKNAIQNAKMKNQADSLSYAFGTVYYNALTADSLFLEPVMFAKAMVDGKNSKAGMTDDIARSYIMVYINKREQDMAAKQAEANKVLYNDYISQNEEFLAKNKEKSGVIVTPSGLQYEVIKMGTGPMPTAESTVKVHYVGTLIDGTEFDSSYKRNAPAEFPVSGVIPGWTEALQLMPVGSKFKIVLPENIAYGANGAGEIIKPFSSLVFEVELIEIVK
ncbi:MAG: FKBP-type peptidyl-prolyl cis-trans isomerase [Bacteroidales bacterium]|jgi:FKBP-type peptidyl-prolyl cis-trans isomerase FklB|nr:FKBP-type peptidyl-prolyl cis-trans isomerase [Bacteroidales bacterium]